MYKQEPYIAFMITRISIFVQYILRSSSPFEQRKNFAKFMANEMHFKHRGLIQKEANKSKQLSSLTPEFHLFKAILLLTFA